MLSDSDAKAGPVNIIMKDVMPMAVVDASWCFNQRKVLIPIVLLIVAECLFRSVLNTYHCSAY